MSDLPPGFRFYPTEEELICFYLRNKLDNRRDDIERVIPVVNVCSVDPWQLSDMHQRQLFAGKEEPWFYFCPRQEKEARGGRPNRTTPSGFWKAAGTPGVVYSAEHRPIGTKKTMVFYRGRAMSGTKTDWKMNEYRAFQDSVTAVGGGGGSSSTATAPNPHPQERREFSLCRLYTRSGCQRQFDRRPRAVAAEGVGKNPGPSSTAADDERGVKRKRSGPSDDRAGGSRGYMQQQQEQQLMPRGTADVHVDNVADWTEFFDLF